MTTTEAPSLNSLIKQALTELDDAASPREIAEAVAELIPEETRRKMLIDALMPQVRTVIGNQRRVAMEGAFAPAPPAPISRPAYRPADLPAPSRPTSIQAERPAPPRRGSAKVDAVRDWWTEMLAARVHVGPNQWMPLGDCGVKELEFAEKERRDQAALMTGQAKKYLHLRTLLDKYEVDTISALPYEARQEVSAQ